MIEPRENGALRRPAPADGPAAGPDFGWWHERRTAGCGGCGHLRDELETEAQAREWLDGHLDVCDPSPLGRQRLEQAAAELTCAPP
ncbi:hypothetical protein [Kitasatospora sp. NPDC088548]|uniref:hypothetical protein n=1 Tax=Kitasatospora sp. NPDC088548 TaxID=3364075 RepID=UPI003822CCF9